VAEARPVSPAPIAARPAAPARAAAPAPAPAAVKAAPAPTAAAVKAAPLPPPQVSEALCSAVADEIRVSIRGRTLSDLTASTGEPPSSVEQACELLIARGQVVRRGQKYFAA
jgi:hypothetical protein